jgi:hypothetical protein
MGYLKQAFTSPEPKTLLPLYGTLSALAIRQNDTPLPRFSQMKPNSGGAFTLIV